MPLRMSRRAMVKRGLLAGALMPAAGLLGRSAEAAGLPPLDPSDAQAKSLGFVPVAGKVDASANPAYKAGQKCGTCAQYQGKPGDASGGCNVFVGHSVPSGGWCKVWAAKTT